MRRATAIACGLEALALACGPALPATPPSPEERCRGLLAGDLVISELMVDPSGVDGGRQYLEIFNRTEDEIDLDGVWLSYAAPESATDRRVVLTPAKVAAEGYAVLGNIAPNTDVVPAHVDLGYGTGLGALRHGGGTVGLSCGDALIDETSYSAVDAGRARELDGTLPPDPIANDDESNWCSASTPLDPLEPDGDEFGTPGAPNGVCGQTAPADCVDPISGELRSPAHPRAGELVISEVMPAPAAVGDAEGEWLELFARADVDLNGLTLRAGSSSVTLSAALCLRVGAGTYALLARSPLPEENGGLPAVTATQEFRLPDTASSVEVSSGDASVDVFAWTSSRPGVAWQLAPEAFEAPAEQRQAAFCPATAPYGDGDRGTPGAPNEACPVVVEPGQCLDEALGASRPIERPAPGDLSITELMAHPSVVSDSAGEWFEIVALRTVDLNELELANEGSGETSLLSEECLRVEAGSASVFARSSDPEQNGGLPAVLATFSFALPNTGPHAIAVRSEGAEVERVEYEGVTQGASLQRSPGPGASGAGGGAPSWCVTPSHQTYGLGDRGSPGAPNVACDAEGGMAGAAGTEPSGQCRDATSGLARDPVRPGGSDLVISEIMAAPTTGNNGPGEWFELFARMDVDLNDIELSNQGGKSVTLTSDDCLPARAGEYLLFARSADPAQNGGLPPVTATFGFPLADTSSASYPERWLSVRRGDTELDRVIWTESDKGTSLQLSSSALDPPASGDAASWCATPEGVTFGTLDRGTPGGENIACP